MIRRNTVRSRSKIIRMKKVPGPQLYSPREKLQDCIWIFTIGDADDKPSVPHAHAQGTGYRLDAWTGDIYPAGSERKRTIGKLSKKELARLHSDPGFLKFARKQIQWYRENNPKINFYVPEWFTTLTRRSKLAAIKQEGVLNSAITNYCSDPQKIMFILQKTDADDTYNKLFYEIKIDLFQIEKEGFTDALKSLISL